MFIGLKCISSISSLHFSNFLALRFFAIKKSHAAKKYEFPHWASPLQLIPNLTMYKAEGHKKGLKIVLLWEINSKKTKSIYFQSLVMILTRCFNGYNASGF